MRKKLLLWNRPLEVGQKGYVEVELHVSCGKVQETMRVHFWLVLLGMEPPSSCSCRITQQHH